MSCAYGCYEGTGVWCSAEAEIYRDGSAPMRSKERTLCREHMTSIRRGWLETRWSGMLRVMSVAHVYDQTPIPSAPVADLDLDLDDDEEEWERRVMDLAATRIQAARHRLEALGIVDRGGELVSRSLPADMAFDSNATLETG